MPNETEIARKLEAKIAEREKIAREIAELKSAKSKAKKAQREKDAGRIGRLAVATHLDTYDNQTLKTAFKMLAAHLESGTDFLASPNDQFQSEERKGAAADSIS